MKIAALVVFKDEADVLPHWLKYMDKKVDYFLFRDNESTDNSAEIVKNHPKTVFYEKVCGQFRTSMWDKLIEESQKYLSDEDWFIISAPDLFPLFDLRSILMNLSPKFNCLSTYYPVFFFTQEMYKRYKRDRKYRNKINSFNIDNYKYFKVTGKTQPPLIIKNTKVNGDRVRYTKPKQEPPFIPQQTTYLSHLCVGHYRFRSPQQMQDRMELRKKVNPNRDKTKSFKHYPTWDWCKYLISEQFLYMYNDEFDYSHIRNNISLDHLIKWQQAKLEKELDLYDSTNNNWPPCDDI